MLSFLPPDAASLQAPEEPDMRQLWVPGDGATGPHTPQAQARAQHETDQGAGDSSEVDSDGEGSSMVEGDENEEGEHDDGVDDDDDEEDNQFGGAGGAEGSLFAALSMDEDGGDG